MKNIISVIAFGGALAMAMNAPAIPATEPAPRYNFQHAAWWFGRFDKLRGMAEKEGGSYGIAFIGDSITENWEAPGTNVWNRTFADGKYKAICLGFGGDRTEHLLWRVQNGQFDGLKPKAIVLLIGANNIFARKERDEPPADTVRAIAEIIECLQAKCPNAKIILNAVIPANEKPDDETRLRGVRTNEQLKRLADGEKVLWLDFGSKLLEPDGTLTKEMAPDLVHPSEKGYVIWSEMLMPYLDWCLGTSQERPKDVGFEKNSRSAVWTSDRYAAKRDEILANAEHYYDCAMLGDALYGMSDEDVVSRRRALGQHLVQTGYKVLDFPFDFKLSVRDAVWAVENAGLCDGYSARVVTLSEGLWRYDAAKGEAKTVFEDVKALIAAVQKKQPQARIVLEASDKVAPQVNDGLCGLADGEKIYFLSSRELLPTLKKIIK